MERRARGEEVKKKEERSEEVGPERRTREEARGGDC